MYKLVISDDEGKTIIVPLVRDLITVGRQDGNTIRLTERNVSRQHARLVRTEAGYRLEDLESYNGVSVNGTRINKVHDLKDGDRVGIGDYVLSFKVEAEASASAPPVSPRASVPPAATPPARLVMVSAPAPGAEFSIAKPTVRIGRLEELDLCISHRSISREHARITQRDGNFEIEDLNSANGIRVNGSSVRRSALRSGDIVELGQVRFRFVGAGEAYTFDPNEEEPLPLPGARGLAPERRTVAVVVVTAAVVGGALALLDDGGRPAGAASRTVGPAAEDSVAPGPVAQAPTVQPTDPEPSAEREINSQLYAALEGCRTLLAAERYEEAARAAQNGLALDDSDTDLMACKGQAEDGLRARSAYEQGSQALAENKLEDAYFLFEGIPEGSPYRERPEVKQTMQRVALGRLTEARKMLKTNPAETRRIALSVLDMYGLTTPMVEDAHHLIRVSSRNLPASYASARARASANAQTAAANAPIEGESPAKAARNCLARGDQRCAVRALEGHAENAQELALLIETYRALGETKKAVKHMESFVERYPTARQVPQYRQFIAKHDE